MNEKLNSLREKAEQILTNSALLVTDIPLSDFNRIIHDLKVYQIELELQNEELRSAQKQLEESRNRFAELYNEAPAGYVTLNATGAVLQANQTFLQMVKLGLPEVLNFSFAEFLSSSDRHLFLSRFNAFFKKPADKIMELKLLRRGGKPIYIRITGNLKNDFSKDNGQKAGDGKLFLIIHDITSQKMVEAKLIESEYNFRTLANSGQALIWASGIDHQHDYFNDVWLNFTGRPLEEELGYGWTSAVHHDDLETCLRIFTEAFERRERVTRQYRLRRHDGEYRWLQDDACPRYTSNGDFSGYLGFCLDITASKQVEADLLALNETLEERVDLRTKDLESSNRELQFHLREIEQFGYISSHDLQEPLRTLTTVSQLVFDEYSDKVDDTGKKYLEFILQSAGRMRELVKGLLEYSLLGKEGVKTPTDCNEVIKDVLNDLGESIRESGTAVIAGHLPVVNAYQAELRVLFQNLITNAIKFRSTDYPSKIVISAVTDEHGSLFSIEDNGIGIAENDREKIFIIFKRLHNRNLYSGTGIGLAHCKKITELHGGTIWVEPVEGRGSRFCFTIPR